MRLYVMATTRTFMRSGVSDTTAVDVHVLPTTHGGTLSFPTSPDTEMFTKNVNDVFRGNLQTYVSVLVGQIRVRLPSGPSSLLACH